MLQKRIRIKKNYRIYYQNIYKLNSSSEIIKRGTKWELYLENIKNILFLNASKIEDFQSIRKARFINEKMGSNLDLRKFQSADSIVDAYSKIVSGGKIGYKAVIERKKIPPKCVKCGRGGDDGQKFCPQCGGKMLVPLINCLGCKKRIDEGAKFCTECGHNLTQEENPSFKTS